MTDTDTHAAQRVREAVAALNAAVADAERVGLTVEVDRGVTVGVLRTDEAGLRTSIRGSLKAKITRQVTL